MGKCKFCGKSSSVIADILQICRSCILKRDWTIVLPHIHEIHHQVRSISNLPEKPPIRENISVKLQCNLCLNNCSLSNNDTSYCGLRSVKKDNQKELPNPGKSKGFIHGYTDANPTNCCASWFCPAGTSSGYPEYSNHKGPEFGTYSYAAFMYGCTFNCLFCQNSSHKNISRRNFFEVDYFVEQIVNNEKITCICYFGGTPEAQLPFTINLANKIMNKIERTDPERKFRVCWEWNGSGNPDLVKECMEIAIKSGGNIKFDLKSFNEKINVAMCGISNIRTLDNFRFLAENYFGTRGDTMPEMSACTLLVPGYVNYEEVSLIAKYISEINPKIPYSLLIFHPDYMMQDLPITPKDQAMRCLKAAKKYLDNVNLGNKFLLGFS